MTRHDDDGEPVPARESSLTRWVVGAVLAVLLGIAFAAANFVFQQTMKNTTDIIALRVDFTRMQSENGEQHKAMLDGIGRIEKAVEAGKVK